MGRTKTYDRSNLLAIAMRTFWRFGYGATTLADLVDATGVDKKTLFREFNNKEGLFSDVLRLYVSSTSQHIDNKLSPQPLGLDNVRRYLDSMTFWTTSPICLLTKTLSEFDLVTDEHRKSSAMRWRTWSVVWSTMWRPPLSARNWREEPNLEQWSSI